MTYGQRLHQMELPQGQLYLYRQGDHGESFSQLLSQSKGKQAPFINIWDIQKGILTLQ